MELSGKKIKEALDESIAFRQQYIESDWRENLFWYNDAYGRSIKLNDTNAFNTVFDSEMFKRAYSVNLAYSVTRTIRDSIYTRSPAYSIYINRSNKDTNEIARITGQPKMNNTSLDTTLLAYVLEKDTKAEMNRMKVDRTNRRIVLDSAIYGYGVTKQGYNIDKDDKTLKDLYDKKELEKIGLDSSAITASDLVKSQYPYLKRIDPRLFLFPESTVDFGEFSWIAQEVYMTKENALKKYGVKLPEDSRATTTLPGGKTKTKAMVKLYEFHWLGKNPQIFWLDNNGNILKKVKYPIIDREGNAKCVYNFLWFNDGYESFYPVADLTLVRSQIIEANLQKRRRVDHLNRFSNQFWFTGPWDSDQIQEVCDGSDGSYVHSSDVRSRVGQLPKPELGQEFYNNIQSIEAEMYQVLGLTDYAVGGATQKRMATEAKYVEENYSTKLLSRIAMVDDFVHNQVDLLIEFKKNYMFLEEEKYTEGPDKNNIYWVMSGEMLNLVDPEILVTKGSTFELDRDYQIMKANEFTKLAQTYGPVVNLPEACKYAFELLGVPNPEKFIMDQSPQPVPTPGGDGGARVREVAGQPGQVDDEQGAGLQAMMDAIQGIK